MLGLRGCRLGILFPEIYEMQARAIFEAAFAVAGRRRGSTVVPEMMIPLVLAARELQLIKAADRRGGGRGRPRSAAARSTTWSAP